jgi:1-acyl-sn-glycerol-3-phosphate acyltransferase
MYRLLKRALPPVTDRYFHTRIEGVENVPDEEPVIIAINHLSVLEHFLVPVAIPRPVYFLGKSDYWDSWKTRWFFRGVGVVPVYRDGGEKGNASLRTGVEILGRGDIVGIYPEGTRSPDGRLYRGKTGPVRMALEAGVRIVPVGVSGTDRAMPTGSYLAKRVPVTIRYGEPLDFSRYADRKTDPFVLRSATDELMYEIMLLSGQEYVDEYGSRAKSGSLELDQHLHQPTVRRAPEPDAGASRRAG